MVSLSFISPEVVVDMLSVVVVDVEVGPEGRLVLGELVDEFLLGSVTGDGKVGPAVTWTENTDILLPTGFRTCTVTIWSLVSWYPNAVVVSRIVQLH